MSDLVERLCALEHFTGYGADYNRNVAEPFHTARRMLVQGRRQEAEYWVLQAEMRAGVVSFEEWQAAVAGLRGQLF